MYKNLGGGNFIKFADIFQVTWYAIDTDQFLLHVCFKLGMFEGARGPHHPSLQSPETFLASQKIYYSFLNLEE